MEKFWSTLEDQHNINEHPEWETSMEIIKLLMFSPYTELGEIRKQFDKWSCSDLQSLAEYFHCRYVDDDGVYEDEGVFGERQMYGLDDYREAFIINTLSGNYFQLFSKRKRFF